MEKFAPPRCRNLCVDLRRRFPRLFPGHPGNRASGRQQPHHQAAIANRFQALADGSTLIAKPHVDMGLRPEFLPEMLESLSRPLFRLLVDVRS